MRYCQWFFVVYLCLSLLYGGLHPHQVSAQTLPPKVLDSLERVLVKTTNPEEKEVLYKKLLEAYRDRVPQKTLELVSQAEAFALKESMPTLYIMSQYMAGMAYIRQGEDSSALFRFKQGLKVALEQRNNEQAAYINFQMSRIQRNLGNYTIALDLMLMALQTFEKDYTKSAHEKLYPEILEGLGYLYYLNKDYGRAIASLHRSVAVYRTLDSMLLIKPYSRLSLVYRELHQLDSALWYCQQSLNLCAVVGDKFGTAYGKRDLASLFRLQKNFPVAIALVDTSIILFKELNHTIGLSEAYYELAAIQFASYQYQDAITSLDRALTLIEKMTLKNLLSECLALKAQCYAAQNDYKRAYEAQRQYVQMRDSLYSTDMIRRTVEMQTHFEVARKEEEIQQLHKEREMQMAFQLGLTISIIAAGVILLVLYNRYTIKKRSEGELRTKNDQITLQQKTLSEQAQSITQANKELQATLTEVREANDRKGEFLSIAAHDLKNPLGSIKGYAELLFTNAKVEDMERTDAGLPRTQLIEDSLEFLPFIKQSAEHMVEIITDLLNTETLQTGNVEMTKDLCDLYEIANVVVYGNKPQAVSKNIVIHFTAEQECYTSVDVRRMREVFDNIVSNAIKYSPQERNVWIELRKCDIAFVPHIRFSVRDEGPGFTDDDKMKLFGKFQKLSARPTAGESSTGLGLSIVKTIVELHGGTITVESQYGQGAMFVVNIPVELPSDFSV